MLPLQTTIIYIKKIKKILPRPRSSYLTTITSRWGRKKKKKDNTIIPQKEAHDHLKVQNPGMQWAVQWWVGKRWPVLTSPFNLRGLLTPLKSETSLLSSLTRTEYMATALLLSVTFLLLVLVFFPSPSAMAAARPSKKLESSEYGRLNTRNEKAERVIYGREVEGCMPREFRVPPSAPSRYGNYHTLGGDLLCEPKGQQRPWAIWSSGGWGRRRNSGLYIYIYIVHSIWPLQYSVEMVEM